MTEEEPLIIRASSTSSYADCSLRAAVQSWPHLFKKLGYEPRQLKKNIAASVGTGAHGAVAHSLTVKMETGRLAPEADAVEAGIAAFAEDIKDGVEPDKITPNKNVAHHQIQRISRSFNTVGYKLDPVLVELRLNAQVPSVPGFWLSGRCDQITTSGAIYDLKTGRSAAPYIYQAGLYAVIAEANKQSLGISEVTEAGVIKVRRSGEREEQPDPSFDLYDLEKAKRMGLAMFRRIVRDIKTFEETQRPELSFTQNPFSLMCKASSCPAFGTQLCDSWRSKPKEDD
jgi:hypothetical protein